MVYSLLVLLFPEHSQKALVHPGWIPGHRREPGGVGGHAPLGTTLTQAWHEPGFAPNTREDFASLRIFRYWELGFHWSSEPVGPSTCSVVGGDGCNEGGGGGEATSLLLGAPRPRGVSRHDQPQHTEQASVPCSRGRRPPSFHPRLAAWLQTMRKLSHSGRRGQRPGPKRCGILSKPLGVSELRCVMHKRLRSLLRSEALSPRGHPGSLGSQGTKPDIPQRG